MSRTTAAFLTVVIGGGVLGCAKAGPAATDAIERPERQPVASTVATPPSPRATHRASRQRTQPAAMDSDDGGISTLLLRIRSCESGPNGYATHGWAFDANYTETNPASTASGAWQFLDSTWHYVTGLPGRAKDYSAAVQDAAALKLYATEGTRPWEASRTCWAA